jgi:hypothetical protein
MSTAPPFLRAELSGTATAPNEWLAQEPVVPAPGAEEVQVQDGGRGKESVPLRGKYKAAVVEDRRCDTDANRSVANKQPFSWKAGALFVLTGAALVYYFEFEKDRMRRKRIADSAKGVGRPKVGGPFELIDQYGNTVTDKDLKGRYSLVSAPLEDAEARQLGKARGAQGFGMPDCSWS